MGGVGGTLRRCMCMKLTLLRHTLPILAIRNGVDVFTFQATFRPASSRATGLLTSLGLVSAINITVPPPSAARKQLEMVLIQLILAFPFKINKLCFSLIWPPNVPAACRLVSPNILAKKGCLLAPLWRSRSKRSSGGIFSSNNLALA